MRRKHRIQPYVTAETQQQLREFAAATRLGESFVVQQALQQFMERDGLDRDLVVRRLDRQTAEVARLRHDIDVLAESFAVFVRAWFMHTPIATDLVAARQRADLTYKDFVEKVGSRLVGLPEFIADVDAATRRGRDSGEPEPGA